MQVKIVMTVAVIELAFVILEGWYSVNCYFTGSECWPWFFTMMANFPAAIGIFKFAGFIYDLFHVESFWAQTTLMAGSFLIIGTLWWSLILHCLVMFYKYTSRFIGDRQS